MTLFIVATPISLLIGLVVGLWVARHEADALRIELQRVHQLTRVAILKQDYPKVAALEAIGERIAEEEKDAPGQEIDDEIAKDIEARLAEQDLFVDIPPDKDGSARPVNWS